MSFWDKEATLKVIQKNEREEVRVGWGIKKGRKFITIREWFTPPQGGDKMPSKSGINIPLYQFNEVSSAMQEAAALVKAELIIPESLKKENHDS